MIAVRPAWQAANPALADSPYAGRLPAWASAPGSTLLVAPGSAGLDGMVLVPAVAPRTVRATSCPAWST